MLSLTPSLGDSSVAWIPATKHLKAQSLFAFRTRIPAEANQGCFVYFPERCDKVPHRRSLWEDRVYLGSKFGQHGPSWQEGRRMAVGVCGMAFSHDR